MTTPPSSLSAALADRYRIERELGQGGMATVYLAQDLKHDRQVAVKVLRPELAAVLGAERFLTEIKTTANLQHPHILPLFDSGRTGGQDGRTDDFLFYVMPYIEGESLRDRLSREKQLPIADAVRIATEVASALHYAHRHNVIHRDIKPENILLHDGSALVVDFGIALAVSAAGGTRMTETGLSLGTPHYMSPEQAMGEREITARSDIYALGVVTYEMLTGEPPFNGPTAQAIVARVMTDAPRSLVSQRHTVPEAVEAAVLTALEKLPADRFASAAEFAAALGGPPDWRTGGPGTGRRSARPPDRRSAPLAAATVLVAALAGWLLGRRETAGALPMVFGPTTKVTWEQGFEILPAISPDGKSVAYATGTAFRMQIIVRPVAGGRSIRLTDDTAVVQSHPRWSPDGTRILFLANGGAWSAPAAGGPARPEVPAGRTGPVLTAAYAPDGKRIAYVVGDSVFLRNEDGTSRGLATFHQPNVCAWSPTGALIACGSGNAMSMTVSENFGNISPSSIVVFGFADGRARRVTDSLTLNQNPVWSPSGRWLYFVSNRYGPSDIYGQRLSGSGEPAGTPVRLSTGLRVHTFSLSADGRRLAYSSLASESNVQALQLRGPLPVPMSAATPVTLGNQNIETANASADGQWLYYDSDLSGNMDVYRMSLATGVPERLTTDPADDFAPQPSPDGREVAFHSWRGGASRDIYVMPLDGGPTQRITTSPEQEALAAWAPDGNGLTFCEFKAGGSIWIVRRVNGVWGPPVKRLDHGFWPDWSPDGLSLLFTTDLTAGALYTVPVDSGPEQILLPANSALAADKGLWMRGGTEVMFRGRDTVGRRYIYTIPARGGTPRRVAVVENRVGVALVGGWGYAPDRIFYRRIEQQSDIAVMEVVP